MNQDPKQFIAEMAQKTKLPLHAVIREAECIGCTKCIQACPVDAILGASKQMHTVLTDVCIGCELCIKPCPVDCIDLIPYPMNENIRQPAFIEQSRQRYQQRQTRLAHQQQQQQNEHQSSKLEHDSLHQTLAARQSAIQAVLARSRTKKKLSNESSKM